MKNVKLANSSNSIIENFQTPYIIAEIGANHNGDMDLARKMIDSAVDCGVDAVKFQSWSPKTLISKEEYDRNQSYDDSPKKHFGSLKEMVEKYYLREDQHYELKDYCDSKGVDFSSSPFSSSEVKLLNDIGVPFMKIASMDINNFELLESIAEVKKPVILSTGMSSLSEIDKAIEFLNQRDCYEIILLHCISIYPPEYQDIHLRNITMLQKTFDLPVGFSDHTIGYSIPLASVALGACVIEKHFTIDKNLPGWDHEISADPTEMKIICEQSKNIALSIGSYKRTVSEAEEQKKKKFRRSLVVTQSLSAGHTLIASDLTSKRPGTGLSPDLRETLIGRELKNDISEDSIITWDDIK